MFSIVSYRKTILDNMQLQYVYCTCNSIVKVGKQCILLNRVIRKSIGFRAGMDLNDYRVQLLHIADEETEAWRG